MLLLGGFSYGALRKKKNTTGLYARNAVIIIAGALSPGKILEIGGVDYEKDIHKSDACPFDAYTACGHSNDGSVCRLGRHIQQFRWIRGVPATGGYSVISQDLSTLCIGWRFSLINYTSGGWQLVTKNGMDGENCIEVWANTSNWLSRCHYQAASTYSMYPLTTKVEYTNAWKEWIKDTELREHITSQIFTLPGQDKAKAAGIKPFGMRIPVLLDDFNKNLREWRAAGGLSVKKVKEINDTGKIGPLWVGYRVRYDWPAKHIADEILAIVRDAC